MNHSNHYFDSLHYILLKKHRFDPEVYKAYGQIMPLEPFLVSDKFIHYSYSNLSAHVSTLWNKINSKLNTERVEVLKSHTEKVLIDLAMTGIISKGSTVSLDLQLSDHTKNSEPYIAHKGGATAIITYVGPGIQYLEKENVMWNIFDPDPDLRKTKNNTYIVKSYAEIKHCEPMDLLVFHGTGSFRQQKNKPILYRKATLGMVGKRLDFQISW